MQSGNKIHAGCVTGIILFPSCCFHAHEAHNSCAGLPRLPYLSHSKAPRPPCGTGYSQTVSYRQHRQSNWCAKSVSGHASLPAKQTNKQKSPAEQPALQLPPGEQTQGRDALNSSLLHQLIPLFKRNNYDRNWAPFGKEEEIGLQAF